MWQFLNRLVHCFPEIFLNESHEFSCPCKICMLSMSHLPFLYFSKCSSEKNISGSSFSIVGSGSIVSANTVMNSQKSLGLMFLDIWYNTYQLPIEQLSRKYLILFIWALFLKCLSIWDLRRKYRIWADITWGVLVNIRIVPIVTMKQCQSHVRTNTLSLIMFKPEIRSAHFLNNFVRFNCLPDTYFVQFSSRISKT